MGYKSVLILSEMVYVKQMHEDAFSLVRASVRGGGGGRGGQRFLAAAGCLPPPDLRGKKLLFIGSVIKKIERSHPNGLISCEGKPSSG